MGWIEELCNTPLGMRVARDVPMSGLTTFGFGGPAEAVLYAASEEDVAEAVGFAKKRGVPFHVMGNGSNLIVKDGGVPGLVLVIGKAMAQISFSGSAVRAGAGASLSALAHAALQKGLQGLEWSAGIPGVLGGACAMNAGAYDGDLAQVLKTIRYYDFQTGEVVERKVQPSEFGYRQSPYAAPERITLSAELLLSPDDGGAKARQEEYMRRRREKQPLSFKSAGSTFKRPQGQYAGAMIEGAGLKEARVGGAVVSPLHAGFIVNDGGATAADVLALIALVQQKVEETYGQRLQIEPKVWGE